MLDHSEINASFQRNGWTATKPLSEFDETYLSEDLAQYEYENITIDFGFYGDGVEPVNGEFRVYLIKDGDWGNPLATYVTKHKEIALSFLKQSSSSAQNLLDFPKI